MKRKPNRRKQKGRALFYTRDSGGKHENTPAEYVAWGQRKAGELGLSFDGTPDAIDEMIREGQAVRSDLFIDYDVKGNVLSREGLDALSQEANNDTNVSHILIPRRDRLARPDHPLAGIELENRFRFVGLTLVFMDKVLPPLQKGKRQNIAELIVAAVDYDRSGQDRRDLAEKIIYAQIRLATMGFSTGGRPPYGFERWLAKEDRTPVRRLADGERVRMAGHHVVWLSKTGPEWDIIKRILEMLEEMPASRVAGILTEEGVPTPDHDRYRTDNGVRHRTSGVWRQSTISNIARNPLLLAVVEHGRRSMGDQLRFTPTGPRELADEDRREDDRPRVIRNGGGDQITASANFDPLVDTNRHRSLIATLDKRGGTQRGKPRSRDPDKNPLGSRVFDMNCSWPMYREPYSGSFRYKCGLYQQSHGAKCAHNHVDGPTAARFVLSCVRQRVLSPRRLNRFEKRLRELASQKVGEKQPNGELDDKRRSLSEVETELEKVSRNLALAESPEQYKAVADIFEQLKKRQTRLENEIAVAESTVTDGNDVEAAIHTGMQIVLRLAELISTSDCLRSAGEIFRLVNARLFLGFRPVRVKNRTLNKTKGGVVTFGDDPPPIRIYEGRTARREVKSSTASAAIGPGEWRPSPPPESCAVSGREDKSLGNVSRGDWI